MTLTERIETEFIGATYPGIDRTEEELLKLTGLRMTWFRHYVTDVTDGDETEGTQVLVDAFESDGQELIVRVAYYDVTGEIVTVDVSEPAI